MRHQRTGQVPARRIGLVVTGGTIGAEYSADEVVRLPVEPNGAEVALLHDAWRGPMGLDLHVRQPLRVLSENMRPGDWVTIAQSVRSVVEEHSVSGVLVLHGTDTATYTTAALSFLLADLEVPIVLTGSNLPPNQRDSDAVKNIGDALIALCNLPPGTYLSFAGEPDLPTWVHLGTQVRKLRASGQAFFSVNRQPVAQVVRGKFVPVQHSPVLHPIPAKAAVDDKVLAVRIYPGLDLSSLLLAARESGTRGVVVELYASGTAPDDSGVESLSNFVEGCLQAGIAVVTTVSDAPDDEANDYESSVALRASGAFFSWTLLPEVAIVKLMWVLAQTSNLHDVSRLMGLNIAGEMARDEP